MLIRQEKNFTSIDNLLFPRDKINLESQPMPLQKAFVYSYLIDDRQHRCVGKLVNAGPLQESEETDTISFNS